MMLVKEAAKIWGLTARQVAGLCKEGKIEGAEKKRPKLAHSHYREKAN